jgi:hypothetical protein
VSSYGGAVVLFCVALDSLSGSLTNYLAVYVSVAVEALIVSQSSSILGRGRGLNPTRQPIDMVFDQTGTRYSIW